MTEEMTDKNTDGNTDGTLDISDYANSILDASLTASSIYFFPYIFCPADCNLNFPALFGLAAVITNPCGCVN